MQVVLHIGTDKTGSTAIQNTLSLNRSWLAARSVFIPQTGLGEGNGHAALLREPDAAGYAALSSELRAARQQGFERALLSWEGMGSQRFTRAEIRRLAAALEGAPVRILVYLREQAEIIQSGHLQRIKQQRSIGDIRSLLRPRTPLQWLRRQLFLRNPNRNYHRLLRRWQRGIPGAEVTVRIFDRQQLREGDVVADFIGQLGLAPDAGFRRAAREYNPSLDVESALLLETLQQEPGCAGQMDVLVDVVQSVAELHGRHTRFFLDPAAVAVVRRHFHRSNRRLARHFLAGASTPFPNPGCCWREEPLAALEARSSTLAERVAEVRRIPTLRGAVAGAELAAQVDLYQGWSSPQPWGVWSVGAESRLRFRLFRRRLAPDIEALTLVIKGRYFGGNRVTRVRVNNLDLGERHLAGAGAELRVPREALGPCEVLDISLVHTDPVSPRDLRGRSDRRALAFGIERIAYATRRDTDCAR